MGTKNVIWCTTTHLGTHVNCEHKNIIIIKINMNAKVKEMYVFLIFLFTLKVVKWIKSMLDDPDWNERLCAMSIFYMIV